MWELLGNCSYRIAQGLTNYNPNARYIIGIESGTIIIDFVQTRGGGCQEVITISYRQFLLHTTKCTYLSIINIYIYIYRHTHTYIYIYIYIYNQRFHVRENEVLPISTFLETLSFRFPSHQNLHLSQIFSSSNVLMK